MAPKADPKPCTACGRPVRRNRNEFCSNACRWAERREARSRCETCNGPRKRGRGSFCSRACSNASRRRIDWPVCEVCGATIRRDGRPTCSIQCRGILTLRDEAVFSLLHMLNAEHEVRYRERHRGVGLVRLGPIEVWDQSTTTRKTLAKCERLGLVAKHEIPSALPVAAQGRLEITQLGRNALALHEV